MFLFIFCKGTGGSQLLKQAYHPVQPDVLCSRLVGPNFVPKTMICAGSMAPLNGVCHVSIHVKFSVFLPLLLSKVYEK